MKRLIAAPVIAFLPCIEHPENAERYEGMNIFSVGRDVIEPSFGTRAVMRFLMRDEPHVVIKKQLKVHRTLQNQSCIILYSPRGKARRLTSMGDAGVIYGAFFEENGGKYFLGWTNKGEWGLLTKIQLACLFAKKECGRWIVLDSPVPLGGLTSPGQDARAASRKFFSHVFGRLDRVGKVVEFHTRQKAQGVTEIQVRSRYRRWTFCLPQIDLVRVSVSVLKDPIWGEIKVADFYPFGEILSESSRIVRFILGMRLYGRWKYVGKPIVIDAQARKQSQIARINNFTRALLVDFPAGHLFHQDMTEKIQDRGWLGCKVGGRRVGFTLSRTHAGKIPHAVVADYDGKKVAYFWESEEKWRARANPLRDEPFVLAERRSGNWEILSRPYMLTGSLVPVSKFLST